MQGPRQPDVVAFGAYEIHLTTQELFKHGLRIRLAPQAFRVLQMLLDHGGSLVTREEFHRALWPADTFVDFDHGLNNAIKKIRDVLNDSAESPRYIETLPRLGYRFIGHVNGSSNTVAVEPKTALVEIEVTDARPIAPRNLNPQKPDELNNIAGKALQKNRDLASGVRAHLKLLQHETEASKTVVQTVPAVGAKGARPENEGLLQPTRQDASLPNPPAPPPRPARWTSLTRWKSVSLAAAIAALAIGAILWFQKTEYLWRNPIADARFQTVTDFDGVAQAAAVSRDGNVVAFLSDREGQMDVWVTQVGSGQYHNLTRGSAPELVNPSVRTLGFSPNGSLVTYWVRKQHDSTGGDISIWAVPTLGGQPRPYLAGVAELDWSHDGSRLTYHTPGPGDPLFVSDGSMRSKDRLIFTAPAGLHSHFPLWAPDTAFIYFVQGVLPDRLDIWRITPSGGTPERITSHFGRVTYPVLLDGRTLIYLATDPDGSGPWLYSADVERRIPHRLSAGLDRYTSLAASADGRRLVATLASPKRTLWRLRIADSPAEVSAATRISLTTSTGFSPRLGPDYLLYVSTTGTSESIWKLANGTATELWSGQATRVFGGPALSPDARYIAFSVRQNGQSLLYVMQADGTKARIVTDSLDLQGAPAWAPDGQSITSAAVDHGVPHLFRVPLDGHSPAPFVQEYSVDPVWAPDGRFVVYSGPDVGTTFTVKAATAGAAAHPLPALTLTRGLDTWPSCLEDGRWCSCEGRFNIRISGSSTWRQAPSGS